jgi:putative FmdB family regulatory protein
VTKDLSPIAKKRYAGFGWTSPRQPPGVKFCMAAAFVAGFQSMPTYQYRCDKCGKKFERTETISEHEALKPKCPKCGSKKVTFVPGRVYVVTSKKS